VGGDGGCAVRLVAIGIGSAIFGVSLLRDIFRTSAFRGAELCLVDTDPVALARMAGFARRLNEASGLEVDIDADSDRSGCLSEADFVVTSVAVDRLATWKIDHELALQRGFGSVLSENGGPGGLSHTLRSVPVMVDIARDIERLAPGAVLFNYTNPENRVCRAIQRYSTIRSIGLCHSVPEEIEWAAAVLGRHPREIDVHAPGLNHFTWFLSIRDAWSGEDLMPEFLERSAADASLGPLARLLRDWFGIHPAIDDSHIGEYLPWAAEIVGTAGYDFEAHERSSRAAVGRLDAMASGDVPVEPLLAEPSEEARVDHSPAQIIADILAGATSRRPSFILPNDGLIDDLPTDSIVEVPGLVDAGRPRGVAVGALPTPVGALLRRELAIQDLAVEAAMEGSRDLALQALLLDPVVTSARAAELYLDDVLRAHRAYLPRFWA
jgi:alpha-galactosidase